MQLLTFAPTSAANTATLPKQAFPCAGAEDCVDSEGSCVEQALLSWPHNFKALHVNRVCLVRRSDCHMVLYA